MPILDLDNSQDVARYDEFLKNSPYACYTQDRAWAAVKQNWDEHYVYLEDDTGKIIAALSLLSVKNDGEHAFLYAQRAPVCDFSDITLFEALLQEALPLVAEENAFLLRISPAYPYEANLLKAYAAKGYFIYSSEDPGDRLFDMPPYNMMMDLHGVNKDNLLDVLPSRVRRYVRKTYRDGLRTESLRPNDSGYETALTRLHDLIKVVADRNDISYRPRDYMHRLMLNYPQARLFQTATSDGEVLAASIVILYNGVATYMYTGSSNHLRNLRAGYQLNYESILYTLEQGGHCYDLGALLSLDKEAGFEAFKLKFGAKDEPTRFIGQMDLVFDEELYEEFMGGGAPYTYSSFSFYFS